jgi:hypothetical protein
VDDGDRQWSAIESVVPDFVGLRRSEAEELAAGLGLHPLVLDWDVLGEQPVQLPWNSPGNLIVLHLHDGVVTRAQPH